ncbi:tRNA-methyltransferase-domain-containing protein [Xylaria sp. CBS 124048]|nr:tRNA-methyltransferase-domain-containing protein [Xylaria sp. CBS 124048]
MGVSDATISGPAVVEKTDGSADISNGAQRGVKRPAEDDPAEDISEEDDDEDDHTSRHSDDAQPVDASGEPIPMTKSQMKKLKRRKKWEEGKELRKQKRRDKRHDRQARKRVELEEEKAAAAAEGREPVLPNDRRRNKAMSGAMVPVSIILDCQFEKYMLEPELVSLSSQVTRCYSDNRNAQHPVHLFISSYGGILKERNETVLENQHLKWKGIRFCEGDFMEAAKEAKERMAGPKSGELVDTLRESPPSESLSLAPSTSSNSKRAKTAPTPEPEADDVDKSVVYLTADSPYTLNRLEPNTCYVVGGIIDKNREKGLCYRLAREKNVRTAKLPIGEYMVLQHRHILATNHVVEIMLKWLETGDWGKAFMSVIPTRKGGKLKTGEETSSEPAEKEAGEECGEADALVENQPVAVAPADADADADARAIHATQISQNLDESEQR